MVKGDISVTVGELNTIISKLDSDAQVEVWDTANDTIIAIDRVLDDTKGSETCDPFVYLVIK